MKAVLKTLTLVALGAIVVAPPAARAAAPSFDCATVTAGSVEEIVCRSPSLAVLDTELARLYRLASAQPAGGNAAALKDEETKWLVERGKCTAAKAPDVCLRDRYVERIAWLRASQKAARRGEASISIGPLAFRCAGIDGLVVVTFVRLEPPLAHVSRKGVSLVLQGQPAASGAKYGTDAGPSFTTHRGEALYRERAGGSDTTCKAEPIT